MRLSAVVAAKKSSERLISPITVSVTDCIACSTSWGTTSWLSSDRRPPSLIRSASSKLIESVFWISSVYWFPAVVMSRVKAGDTVGEDVDVHDLRPDVDERDDLVRRDVVVGLERVLDRERGDVDHRGHRARPP